MRLSILIISIIFICSCGRREKTETSTSSNMDSLISDTTTLTTECIQNDTVTEMGTKIHYIFKNGEFQISWGDNFYQRTYDSLYSCDYDKSSGLWDFVPKFYSETKNYLIFTNILWTSGGGNPAPIEYYAIVCPKNKVDSIFEKEFFIKSEGDYLLFGDSNNENIHLLNIETKKNQTILLNPKPYLSRSPTLSIQETEIKGKTLYLKYESLDKNQESIIIEKTFNIEI